MSLDPEHQSLKPEEFCNAAKTEMYTLEDQDGPVYFFRISREIRVDIQFIPGTRPRRVMRGLKDGLDWLEDMVKSNYRAITFDSVYKPLIQFCKKGLGFKESPDLRKTTK